VKDEFIVTPSDSDDNEHINHTFKNINKYAKILKVKKVK